jgi:hypothetical protein
MWKAQGDCIILIEQTIPKRMEVQGLLWDFVPQQPLKISLRVGQIRRHAIALVES